MQIFTKFDKKLLSILILVLVIVLVFGFVLAKSIMAPVVKIENKLGGANTEDKNQSNTDENKLKEEQKTKQEMVAVPTFSICVDKCGDGVCQMSDPSCGKGEQNCICLENKTECPQDCK